MAIDRIELQRASEGRPLDDVIVHAHDASGAAAVLEIQDVLTWARQLGSATTFIARINRAGSANHNMRSFVQTFRTRLQEAGAPHDDETVWGLLRRFQILVYDFTAPGSAEESHARDRAALVLHPDDAAHAPTLWTELIGLPTSAIAERLEVPEASVRQVLKRDSDNAERRRVASMFIRVDGGLIGLAARKAS